MCSIITVQFLDPYNNVTEGRREDTMLRLIP